MKTSNFAFKINWPLSHYEKGLGIFFSVKFWKKNRWVDLSKNLASYSEMLISPDKVGWWGPKRTKTRWRCIWMKYAVKIFEPDVFSWVSKLSWLTWYAPKLNYVLISIWSCFGILQLHAVPSGDADADISLFCKNIVKLLK